MFDNKEIGLSLGLPFLKGVSIKTVHDPDFNFNITRIDELIDLFKKLFSDNNNNSTSSNSIHSAVVSALN
eukprot:Pgem_evm1s17989